CATHGGGRQQEWSHQYDQPFLSRLVMYSRGRGAGAAGRVGRDAACRGELPPVLASEQDLGRLAHDPDMALASLEITWQQGGLGRRRCPHYRFRNLSGWAYFLSI